MQRRCRSPRASHRTNRTHAQRTNKKITDRRVGKHHYFFCAQGVPPSSILLGTCALLMRLLLQSLKRQRFAHCVHILPASQKSSVLKKNSNALLPPCAHIKKNVCILWSDDRGAQKGTFALVVVCAHVLLRSSSVDEQHLMCSFYERTAVMNNSNTMLMKREWQTGPAMAALILWQSIQAFSGTEVTFYRNQNRQWTSRNSCSIQAIK